MSTDRRKTIKHLEADRCVHELTFSCYHRLPLLTNDRWRRLLAQSITEATAHHGYALLGFVFMPEHVHLLVLPQHNRPAIAALLKAIKRPYSACIKQLLETANSPLLKKLTVPQRRGVTAFHYWQQGPGYDRNLFTPSAISAALDYIHLNPIRRNLCRRAVDWKWSSARHYVLDSSSVDPDLPRIDEFPPGLLD